MFRKTISPLWLVFFLLPQLSSAEDLISEKQSSEIFQESVEIEGDSLETLLDRKMKAKGNAILKKGNKTIKAEVIEYDQISEKLITQGNTSIDLEKISLSGTKLNYRLSDQTGKMEDATFNIKSDKKEETIVQKGIQVTKRYYDFRGDAKAIFFEGENKTKLESSRLTTCEVDSNDWYIKSKSMEIDTKKDQVKASHASLDFKGVPIFYMPSTSFSLNKNRQSGFLSSTFGTTSKSGFEFRVPYYFNISPNMDATLTARYLGKRGPLADGEFRYLTENYSGINQLQYMNHDQSSGQDNRYFLKLNHQHQFGRGWSGSYDLQKVSDNTYFSDLATMIQVTSVVNLPQRVNLNYSGDIWKLNLLTEKYQTLTNASNSPYQRLPQVNLSGKKDYDNFILDLKSQWTLFERDDKFASTFTDAQKITGSRFTMTPAITIPLTSEYGYIKPKVSANIRSYNLNNSTDNNKDIVTPIFSLDSGVYLDRNINFLNQNYTNTLEPRLFYVYIPYKDQSVLPNFDSGLADLNMQTLFYENQYNGQDRINDANQLTASLTSKFLDKNGKERLSAIIAQRYYFEDRRVFGNDLTEAKKANSDIFMGASAKLPNSLNLDAMFQFDPTSNSLLRSTLGSRYNPEPGKMLNVSYRLIDNIIDNNQDLEVFNAAGQWPLGNRFYSIGRYNYDLKSSQTIEVLAGLEYDGGCWVARSIFDRISLPTSPNPNYAFFIQLELNGIGSLGSDANKLNNFLYRNVPGLRNVNQIPDVNRQANFN
ncbi:LPS-assembly protein LptD [Candidatus Methylopumilus planktonicus]|uniref:LPS-assembly protein LptD n=1 Tax=Candidatus Methylopumilus planktonicus TaxID=1581557 RepID=UPI00111DDDF6|nr:LPS-assembly protein LptD [Candidatus Methylopumilus planktonicus]QDD06585.1 LPS-assembly protein LptD [Candidatus Methylopumilus planktonicus]QDD07920.1 LPS-assembly protein LptD [Candidatus Methylopumilus planktonicus]QDD09246.1 LPS-assembly protein LptD [Candidatus Methylopumilus planktonicus]